MKTKIIMCSIFFVLCSAVQGANEICAVSPGITNAYGVVRESDGDVWYVTGEVFEVWGTGARTAADYDIALTDKSGGMLVGDMDTNISAGYYRIITHYRVGANPADTDPVVWQEYGYWSGTVWQPYTLKTIEDKVDALPTAAGTADAVWDEAMAGHTGEATFGGELQTLDPNLTLVLADTTELQTDWHDGGRLDLLIDAIKAETDLITIHSTTVAEANDANEFILTDGIGTDVNDSWNYSVIIVQDADDGHWESRFIYEWDSDKEVEVDETLGFTPAAGDVVHIMGTGYGGFLYRILSTIQQARGVLNVIDTTGTSRAVGGVTRIDAFGDDP